jgi:hypothetical protein
VGVEVGVKMGLSVGNIVGMLVEGELLGFSEGLDVGN